MNTERVLKKLFDFQSFEKNPRLERLIRETEGDATALSDDELSLVNAAGDASMNAKINVDGLIGASGVSGGHFDKSIGSGGDSTGGAGGGSGAAMSN